MSREIFILVILLLFSGCKDSSKDKSDQPFQSTDPESSGNYYIQVSSFDNPHLALKYARRLREKINQTIFIDTISKGLANERYVIRIGGYDDPYSAGEAAYKLYKKKILSDYRLTRRNKMVIDPFTNFMFISIRDSLPALFNYDFLKHKTKLFWSIKDERVIELTPSKNQIYSFVITSTGYGRAGAFPHIDNVRVYLVSVPDQTIHQVYNLGSGIQLFTYWVTPNLYKLGFNYFHQKIANSVVEQTLVFNSSGNLLSEENKIYDIIKENYPNPPLKDIENKSPDSRYTINEVVKHSESLFYLVDNSSQEQFQIYNTKYSLRKTEWSGDNQFLIFSTTNYISNHYKTSQELKDSTEIVVFSILKRKITKQWNSEGNKNFFLRGDIIFLDYNSGSNSSIIIYDYRNNMEIEKIRRNGGCGFTLLQPSFINGG